MSAGTPTSQPAATETAEIWDAAAETPLMFASTCEGLIKPVIDYLPSTLVIPGRRQDFVQSPYFVQQGRGLDGIEIPAGGPRRIYSRQVPRNPKFILTPL